MAKLIHWPYLIVFLFVVTVVAYGASAWFGVGFFVTFIVVAVIFLGLGLLAAHEDEQPGGFNNPKK